MTIAAPDAKASLVTAWEAISTNVVLVTVDTFSVV